MAAPRIVSLVSLFAAACASRPLSLPRAGPAAPVSVSAATSAQASARATAPSPPGALPSLLPLVGVAAELKLDVVQVLTLAVSSIALGEGSRIAVLSDPPEVGDARGLHPMPLPAPLRAEPGAVDEAKIFFGRDNEPRIMGVRRSESGETAIYWRHTRTGWRDGREEIGPLGSTLRGALWGVLGAADPELVCRSNASCVVKRATGWTIVPAGASSRIVTLSEGVLWGLDASGVAEMGAHGWSSVLSAPIWSEPRALWAVRGEVWVSTKHELFRYHEGAWAQLPSPISDVAGFWGIGSDSIWMVGKAGVAHFDGYGFRFAEVAQSMRAVQGRTDAEVWFGGDGGLYRARLIER